MGIFGGFGNYPFGSQPFGQPVKPRVFVSYHHESDQYWYNLFSFYFSNVYDLVTDNSLDREVDSESADYVRGAIREKNITGTSLTVVLCGENTYKRRWVDWEIQMTLNKEHALLGIILPTNLPDSNNKCIIPNRLYDNVESGYAHVIHWTIDPTVLEGAIAEAKNKARFTKNINNSRPSMKRSLA